MSDIAWYCLIARALSHDSGKYQTATWNSILERRVVNHRGFVTELLNIGRLLAVMAVTALEY